MKSIIRLTHGEADGHEIPLPDQRARPGAIQVTWASHQIYTYRTMIEEGQGDNRQRVFLYGCISDIMFLDTERPADE